MSDIELTSMSPRGGTRELPLTGGSGGGDGGSMRLSPSKCAAHTPARPHARTHARTSTRTRTRTSTSTNTMPPRRLALAVAAIVCMRVCACVCVRTCCCRCVTRSQLHVAVCIHMLRLELDVAGAAGLGQAGGSHTLLSLPCSHRVRLHARAGTSRATRSWCRRRKSVLPACRAWPSVLPTFTRIASTGDDRHGTAGLSLAPCPCFLTWPAVTLAASHPREPAATSPYLLVTRMGSQQPAPAPLTDPHTR